MIIQRVTFSLFLIYISLNLFGQTRAFSNDTYICWHPGVTIKYSDYTGIVDASGIKLSKKFNTNTISQILINVKVDIPSKKKMRGKLMDEVYFAPVFCKKCSFTIKFDSSEILQNSLFFDIAEYASRVGRMNLDSIRRISNNAYGINSIWAITIKEQMHDVMYDMFSEYIQEVIKQKQVGGYEKWKMKMNLLLEKTSKYATTANECERILSQKPVLENYETPETLIGDMRKRK